MRWEELTPGTRVEVSFTVSDGQFSYETRWAPATIIGRHNRPGECSVSVQFDKTDGWDGGCQSFPVRPGLLSRFRRRQATPADEQLGLSRADLPFPWDDSRLHDTMFNAMIRPSMALGNVETHGPCSILALNHPVYRC